jgi:uncharacterized RDD family membrane protein YckC
VNRVPEPESDSTELPAASPSGQEDLLGRRIGAALIDVALLTGVFAILAATVGEGTVEGGSFSFELDGLEAALYFAFVFLYFFALEAAIGQTVGKLLLGLRIVRADGSRPSVAAVALRTVLRIVDWLPFLYLVGFIAMLVTGLRRQRLGDLAAKTTVARTLPVRRQGLAAATVALVVVVLLGLSFYRATVSGAGETTDRDGLDDLRVCTGQAFDEANAECTEDERERPLRGEAFYCSAKVGGREGERFEGRLLYDDELLFTGGRTVPAGSGTVWVTAGTDGELLPSGRWMCELSVASEEVSARFQSEGPTPQNLGLAACLTANTDPDGACREDESVGPLGPTGSVTCSATILGGKGEVMRVDFVYEGDETVVSVDDESPRSIELFSAEMFANVGNLPEGEYACRFSVSGEPVAEKPFSIAG